MTFTIYCHTSPSGKRYVGQTKRAVDIRWQRHVVDARAGKNWAFQRAIRKYGAESFAHEILETVDTLGAANEAEQWWIGHFCSDDPRFGYNLDAGGTAKNTSAEVRARIAEKARAQWAAIPAEVRREHMAELRRKCPPGKQEAAARKVSAGRPIEEKRALMLYASSRRTVEQRRAGADQVNARLTTEQRSAAARKGHAKHTSEERSEVARRAAAKRTKEERSASQKLAWITRRKKAA